jgi:hypothetical protein
MSAVNAMMLNAQPPVSQLGPTIPESAATAHVEPQPHMHATAPEVVGEAPDADAVDEIRHTVEIVMGNRASDDLVASRIEDASQLAALLARRRALAIDITARVQRITFENPDRAIVRFQITLAGQQAANVDAVIVRRARNWFVSRDTITMMIEGPNQAR